MLGAHGRGERLDKAFDIVLVLIGILNAGTFQCACTVATETERLFLFRSIDLGLNPATRKAWLPY
jgi:hypothetical protein